MTDTTSTTAATLARVAQTLGTTVDEFLLDQRATEDRLTRSRQAVEMMRAFEQVRDPEARRRCIRLIKDLAGAP
ncbi:hypothetical protein CTI14_11335 [Methylobacterium radiotolerans]|nr:hypothetical protein CTI14_11335 [Methylobacterium radiotolerans]